jgi:hypothetical protein
MGRLRKNDTGERRTAFAGYYVTPTELAEIDRRAASAGYSRSDFNRIVILSDLKAPAPPARDPEAIRAVKAEINHLGVNVNQMTRLSHEHHAAPSLKALEGIYERLLAIYEKVMAL